MPYTEHQVRTAIQMAPFVVQEENHFLVPKTEMLRWLKLNPKMKIEQKNCYQIILNSGKPTEAFSCDCTWGTYRDSRSEPNRKYCCHVLAVILYLIDKGLIPEYWKKAININ